MILDGWSAALLALFIVTALPLLVLSGTCFYLERIAQPGDVTPSAYRLAGVVTLVFGIAVGALELAPVFGVFR